MSSIRTSYAVATLLTVVLVSAMTHANAPAGADTLAEGGGGSTSHLAPIATIERIDARNEPGAATIALSAHGNLSYKSFTMKKSAIVVLDVYDAKNTLDDVAYEATSAGTLVKSIRTSQFATAPRHITRVVIELSSLKPFAIKKVADGLKIDFAGGAKLEPAPAPVTASIEAPNTLDELQTALDVIHAAQPVGNIIAKPAVDGRAVVAHVRSLISDAKSANAATQVDGNFHRNLAMRVAALLGPVATHAPVTETAGAAESDFAALDAAIENKRSILLAEAAIDDHMSRLTEQLVEVQNASIDLNVPEFNLLAAQDPEAAADAPADSAAQPEEAAPALLPVQEVQPTTIVAEPSLADMQRGTIEESASQAPATLPAMTGDPLDRIVNLDFRETELSIVVALLAQMAQVNVIGGAELTGTVTAKLKNIPLRQAFEIVLEMNGLGIVEDRGVFKIVPLSEARLADRQQELVFLTSAKAAEVAKTLEGVIVGSADQELVAITPNETTNVVVIAGPQARVAELSELAKRLDVAEPALPVVTQAIRLDYADTNDILPVVETMLTETVGKAEQDPISRSIVVTDAPVVVEQVRELVTSLDRPTKQVQIKAMIVDAVLRDASQIGSDWTVSLLPRINTRGETVGNLENLSLSGGLAEALGTSALDAGVFTFRTLSSDFDINATIAAEVASRNAEILANPTVVTIENKKADILITQEFPYQELTQSTTGPPISSTEFKDIGVTLSVTPRVTNDNQIITDLNAKQSSISGLSNGVPIEDKREAVTTLRTRSGQTAFIGGLRNISDRMEISKIPILGDVPILNFLFKNTQTEKINTELLIFLTCYVIEPDLPVPTDEQQTKFDKIGITPLVPDSQRAAFRHFLRPQEMRDPFWKWQRTD